jgi:serine/threonine-protein kinase RsbW
MIRAGTESGEDAVLLVVPGRPDYLRLVRLAAADCGARAGLSIDDVEDLRIAVDELAYALFGDEPCSGELTLRLTSAKGWVEVIGECPNGVAAAPAPIEPGELSRTIISAVADEHEIAADDSVRRFRLVKRART